MNKYNVCAGGGRIYVIALLTPFNCSIAITYTAADRLAFLLSYDSRRLRWANPLNALKASLRSCEAALF